MSSREIAHLLEKQHSVVLRAIRELHCSEEFRRSNFAPFKIKDLTGDSTTAATGEALPTIFARDGEVYTNSQHVAAYFGKRHDHVLRDIDAILAGSPDLGNQWFQQVSSFHATANKEVRSFDLTKDGFTLLVTGYTGAKAMHRIVENMGLNWAGQHAKLVDQRSKFACMDIHTHDTGGREQTMLCIPVDKLPLWLATINPNKVWADLRETDTH